MASPSRHDSRGQTCRAARRSGGFWRAGHGGAERPDQSGQRRGQRILGPVDPDQFPRRRPARHRYAGHRAQAIRQAHGRDPGRRRQGDQLALARVHPGQFRTQGGLGQGAAPEAGRGGPGPAVRRHFARPQRPGLPGGHARAGRDRRPARQVRRGRRALHLSGELAHPPAVHLRAARHPAAPFPRILPARRAGLAPEDLWRGHPGRRLRGLRDLVDQAGHHALVWRGRRQGRGDPAQLGHGPGRGVGGAGGQAGGRGGPGSALHVLPGHDLPP